MVLVKIFKKKFLLLYLTNLKMKKMKKSYLLPLFVATLFMFSCGNDGAEKHVEEVKAKVEEVKEEVEKVEEIVEEVANTLSNVGIGSVKELVFEGDVDADLAKKGEELYASKGCTACHNPTMKIVGPAPQGIFENRNPAWVMNMIMNTTEMLAEDADAKALLAEFNNIPMTEVDITEEETRAIVEYFRTIE